MIRILMILFIFLFISCTNNTDNGYVKEYPSKDDCILDGPEYWEEKDTTQTK